MQTRKIAIKPCGSEARTPWLLKFTMPLLLALGMMISFIRASSAVTIVSLTLDVNPVFAYDPVKLTVNLSDPAPAGGLNICLYASEEQTVSSYMYIGPGQSSNFTRFAPPNKPTTYILKIAADLGGNVKSTQLTVKHRPETPGCPPQSQYLYEIDDLNATVRVPNFRVDDIYMPKTIKVAWDDVDFGMTDGVIEIRRDGVALGRVDYHRSTHSALSFLDQFEFTSGVAHVYTASVISGTTYTGLSRNIPANADPSTIKHVYHVDYGPPVNINVTPYELLATDNQAIDSRIDKRYSANHFLNFKFGNTSYRGGLFVGNALDSAVKGRSYFKFDIPPYTPGANHWFAGTVNAYMTRGLKTGNFSVQCQQVSNTWNQASLNWSMNEGFSVFENPRSLNLSYNSANPVGQWGKWDMLSSIASKMSSESIDHAFAARLTALNEDISSWTYFAKKEWDPLYGPRILLAFGKPLSLYNVYATPNPVLGGNTVTVVVRLNGIAPAGGVSVAMGCSDPDICPVPACLFIPEGQSSVTMTITTATVTDVTNVSIWASSAISDKVSTVLVVNP